ncbi:hypothetical protein Tco_0695452 [Tanacetum coccineum]
MLKLGLRIDEDNAVGDVVMSALEEADVTQSARWKKSIEFTVLSYTLQEKPPIVTEQLSSLTVLKFVTKFRMALTASFAAESSRSWATDLHASDLSIPIGVWLALSWYDAPPDTTPIEEIAATGWGDEFSDDEVTPGKVTILEERIDWDDDERSGGKVLIIQERLAQNQQEFMSSASSAVTYTSVYTDSEPGRVFWGADEEISDGEVPRVIVLGYDGLPMQPVAPPSPDFVPGPEHSPASIEIPFVPEPEYPEYLVPSEDEAPMEDQPLPADASPVALSPGYVPDSDPEEDPEEDSEEEHADYPADGGDGDDEPSDDDSDDDDADDDEEPFEDEEDDEEEEEHLAPADSPVIPVADPVPSAGDTEAFETDESAPTPRPPQIRIPFAQTRLRRARKTVRPEPPMSASMEACIAKHAAAPTPPLPVASSPLPLPSPLTTSPTDTGAPLGYRAAGIRMRAAVASPPSLLPPTSPRTDIPEADMPPRKRACLTTPAPGYEIGESSAAGAARQPRPTPAVDTWDEIVEAMMEIAPLHLGGSTKSDKACYYC